MHYFRALEAGLGARPPSPRRRNSARIARIVTSSERPGAAGPSGDLLPELLAVQAERRSCVVRVLGEGAEARLSFEEGTLVHVEEGTTGMALGRLLVDDGKLSAEDLASLLDALAEAEARGKPTRLGDLAVQRGLLTRKELSLSLFAQVRKKVVAALTWESPEVTVLPLPPAAKGSPRPRFPTTLEPLVLSAFRKCPRNRLRARFDPRGAWSLVGSLESIAALFRPKPEERDALVAITADAPPEGLVAGLTRDDEPDDGLAFLATLAATGHLVPSDTPGSRRRPSPQKTIVSNICTVTGARREARSGPAKARFLSPVARPRAKSEPGTDTHAGPHDPSPGSPAAKLRGERAFLEGKAHMAQGREAQAKAEIWRAHRLVPTAAEYELYLAWLTHRGDERRAAELESVALRAKRQDPELGFASYVLAHLALLRGDVERAEAEQARAQRLGVSQRATDALTASSAMPIAEAGASTAFAAMRPEIKRRARRGLPFLARARRPATSAPREAAHVEAAPVEAPRIEAKTPEDAPRSSPGVLTANEPSAIPRPEPRAPAVAELLAHAPAAVHDGAPTETAAEPASTEAAASPTVPVEATAPTPVDVSPPSTKAGDEPRASEVVEERHAEPPRDEAPASAKAKAPVEGESTTDGPPPSSAPESAPMSSAPESALTIPTTSRAPWVGVVLAVAIVATIFYFFRGSSDPKPSPPPPTEAAREAATPDAASSPANVDATVAVVSVDDGGGDSASDHDAAALDATALDATALEDARPPEAGTSDPSPTRAKTGLLVPEGAPKGRRIFVDGRAVGETPSEVPAPCGTHEVRVGSKGTARTVDIPCGGRVVVGP